ncbi:uncharacterized protein DS421_4g127170 [Arachis hypogaea]|nr:uncharacterized protein DS421_4g127170 [Arachis hypogaea]
MKKFVSTILSNMTQIHRIIHHFLRTLTIMKKNQMQEFIHSYLAQHTWMQELTMTLKNDLVIIIFIKNK